MEFDIRESIDEKSRVRDVPREDRPGDRRCERFGRAHPKTISERPLIGHGGSRYEQTSGSQVLGLQQGWNRVLWSPVHKKAPCKMQRAKVSRYHLSLSSAHAADLFKYAENQ